MRVILRTVRRLSRPRNGLAWVLPIVLVACAVSVLHSTLERSALPREGRQTLELGNHEAAVLLGPLTATAPGAEVEQALELASTRDPGACLSIDSITGRQGDAYAMAAMRELHGCDAQDFGWRLEAGREPHAAGEVLVTRAVGVEVGDDLPDGLLPSGGRVVGIVSNAWARDAYMVILAPGTWQSLGWPAIAARFPRLSASAAVYTTGPAASDLAADLAGRSEDGRLQIHTVGSTTSPAVANPMLYRYPTSVLLLAVCALVLGLRAPVRRRRSTLLVAQGMAPRSSTACAHLADLCTAWVGAVAGLGGGWVVGMLLTPVVARASGHVVPVSASLVDPAVRVVGTVTATLVTAMVVGVVAAGRKRRRHRSEPRATTARHLAAIIGTGLAVAALLSPGDLTVVLLAVVGISVAAGLVAPEIVRWVAHRPWRVEAASRLALRRVRRVPGPTAAILAAAILAVGPGTALMTMAATQTSIDNADARIPPSHGQALYYPSDPVVDALVDRVVRRGSGVTKVDVQVLVDDDGVALTAEAEGMGKVSVLANVADLERVVGASLDADARTALERGGVLWGTSDHGARLIDANGDAHPVQSSVVRQIDERWARDSEGFVLESALDSLGAHAAEPVTVYVGLDDQSQSRVPHDLGAAGVDPTIVRLHRAGDAYTISPMIGLILVGLAVLGIAVLVGAARGRVASLTTQASHLADLGVARSWVARSLGAEIVSTLVGGAAFGTGIAAGVSLVGLSVLGFDAVVPARWLVVYLLGVTVAAALVVELSTRKVLVGPRTA